MHCASCVSKVEGTLRAVDGVTHVSVSLASEDALLDYDPSKTSPEGLIRAVSSAGYGAALAAAGSALPERDLGGLRLRVSVGIALSCATLALGIAQASDWLLLLCSAPVQFWCGASFLRGFLKDILRREATMDTLVGLGTLSAWGYSSAVTIVPGWRGHDVYFEIASFLVSFVLLGRLLEAQARARTQSAIRKLVSLLPAQAHVIRGEKRLELPLSEVFSGDLLLIKPGERIPVDALVVSGFSAVDESTLTGESIPVEKGPAQPVSAGTLNTTGSLEIRATRVGEATLLSQIIETVRRAQASKAPVQRYADLVSSYFVPAVVVIAALTFAVWIALTHSVGASLLPTISVLIISCPCALGLATPAAIIVAMGKATEKGILIRDAEALETLGSSRTMVFDKTGTLTRGKPALLRIHLLGSSGATERDALLWAASAENASEHLLARALLEAAQKQGLELRKLERFKSYPGGGVEARVEEHLVWVGSASFLEGRQIEIPALDAFLKILHAGPGSTWIGMAMDGKLQAAFEIVDLPRPEAHGVLQRLRTLGIQPLLISGDRPETARFIGQSLGFHEGEIFGGVSPTGKAGIIADLSSSERAPMGPVVMIGDGVNDSPALARADVGIAMGHGADVAMESAAITLLRSSLDAVPEAYLLSRRAMRTIRQNLFASFFYNALGIPIAAGVLYPWTGWRLNPMLAGAAMALSSVSVVLNSLRLKYWNWTDS